MLNNTLIIFLSLSVAATPQLIIAQISIDHLLNQCNHQQILGNNSKAEDICRQVLQPRLYHQLSNRQKAFANIALGNALRDQQKLEQAITPYNQAIRLDSSGNIYWAYKGLGDVLSGLGKLDEAIAQYRKAINIDQSNNAYWAYNGLGNALYNQGKLDEAIIAYREAIKRKPNHSQAAYAYIGLGNVLRDKRKFEEAITAFREAISLQPEKAYMAYAYNGLGNVLTDQNKLDEAITTYRQATKFEDRAYTYVGIGYALSQQGKEQEAIAALQTALKLPEDKSGTIASAHTLGHNNLGLVFWRQGKLEAAIAEFDKAEDIDSQFNGNFVYAGNNRKEAERLWKIQRNALGKVDDDRKWLPKDDSSIPVKRSVVRITAEFFTRNKQGADVGTGIVIKREANPNRTLILTARHIIFDGNKPGENIQVEFFSTPPSNRVRMRRDAKLVKMTFIEEQVDLAILEVIGNLPEDIQPLPISSTPISPKIPIRIIGHSGKKREDLYWSVKAGEIGSYNKQKIQLSKVELVPGYSGSPVIDSQNRLLGIVLEGTRDRQESFAYPKSVILEKLRT
jgi:tetratricopeptide (TPR) repeat protein